MISNTITAADLQIVVQASSRHVVRSFMRDLPGFDEKAREERVARTYSRADLTVFVICWELVHTCGMRKDAVAAVLPAIRRECAVPRPIANGARLVVAPKTGEVLYLERGAVVACGVVLQLDELLTRVDSHLNSGGMPFQRDLLNGPVLAATSPMNLSSTRGGGRS